MNPPDAYRLADVIAPNARAQEREVLLGLLAIEAHHVVLDSPSWGGDLTRALSDPTRIICHDPNARSYTYPSGARVIACHSTKLPITDASVDRVGSLVGLHHHPSVFKSAIVREWSRVLRQGGVVALAEVIEGSDVARFLDGPVNRYSGGHVGTYPAVGDASRIMSDAGLVVIGEESKSVVWGFASVEVAARYYRTLFGMWGASELEVAACLFDSFDVESDACGFRVPWRLMFASANHAT